MNQPSAPRPSPYLPYPPSAGEPTFGVPHPGFRPTGHPGYAYPAPPQAPPPAPKKSRRGLIVLGVVAGGLLVAGLFGDREPDRFPNSTPTPAAAAPTTAPEIGFSEEGTVSALDLQPGDCFTTGMRPPPPGSSQPVSTVDAVPCTSPHTSQVVADISYQASDDLADVRANRVGPDCAAQFEQRVDKKILADETYIPTTLVPADPRTWVAEPVAACVVSTEQPTVGSVLAG